MYGSWIDDFSTLRQTETMSIYQATIHISQETPEFQLQGEGTLLQRRSIDQIFYSIF